MRLASFTFEGRATWGIVEGDMIRDLGGIYPDLRSALAACDLAALPAEAHTAPPIATSDVGWLPVIPNPAKILCVGLNYEMHRQETGRADTAYPTIFTRFADSQIGHLGEIVRPHQSVELDYEGELAIVIGRGGRHIPRSQAMEHVAGFCCYNDASIRDFQRHASQFTPGKNFPGTGAFGPWLVTPDEVGPIEALRLVTRLNGAAMQEVRIGEMLFDIPRQIEYCSSFTPLEVGDVIVTGTPGGIGARRSPPVWMKAGDLVEVEIERVGLLRNRVVDEGL